MDALQKQDVPYGNDWDSAAEAAAYGEAADQARPWRSRSETTSRTASRLLAPALGSLNPVRAQASSRIACYSDAHTSGPTPSWTSQSPCWH